MEHAATELTKIMGELVRHAPAEEAPLLAWPVVCGTVVAGRTRALSFRAGVLRVEVPDATWRTQLSELEPQYRSADHRPGQQRRLVGRRLPHQFPHDLGQFCGRVLHVRLRVRF